MIEAEVPTSYPKSLSTLIRLLLSKVKKPENISIFLSQSVSILVSLVSGKLISLYVSPTVFGEYNLQFGIATLLYSILVTPGIQYFKLKAADSDIHYKALFQFFRNYFLLVSFFGIVLGITCKFLNLINFSVLSLIVMSLYLLTSSNNCLYSDFLNIKSKFLDLSKFVIGRQLIYLAAICSLFLINEIQSSFLWLMLLISLVGANFFGLHFVKPYLFESHPNINLNHRTIKIHEIITYSMPLVLMSFTSWVVTYSDRYIINFYLDEASVGNYNAAYGLGSKIFLVLNPLFLIFYTPQIYEKAKVDGGECDANQIIKQAMKLYTVIGIPIIVVFSLFYKKIGLLLLSENYSKGFSTIPIISIGYFFLTMTFLLNLKFYAFKRTKLIFFVTLISSLVNISLNIYFIPKFGLIAASLNAAFSFFLGLLISLFFVDLRI